MVPSWSWNWRPNFCGFSEGQSPIQIGLLSPTPKYPQVVNDYVMDCFVVVVSLLLGNLRPAEKSVGSFECRAAGFAGELHLWRSDLAAVRDLVCI